MLDETQTEQEKTDAGNPSTDWVGLRAQAEKLGISLSELQQKEREKKMRLAKKGHYRVAAPASDGAAKV